MPHSSSSEVVRVEKVPELAFRSRAQVLDSLRPGHGRRGESPLQSALQKSHV
jgi:hypothetical protein